jgi:hypothetical protein
MPLPRITLETGTIAELDALHMQINLWSPRLSARTHWMTLHYSADDQMDADWGKIADGEDPLAAGWEDGHAHIVGDPCGAPYFGFESTDGSVGDTVTCDTLCDALDRAWGQWCHWTKREKKRYTDSKNGGYTAIYMGIGDDAPKEIVNFADVLKDEMDGGTVTRDTIANGAVKQIAQTQF